MFSVPQATKRVEERVSFVVPVYFTLMSIRAAKYDFSYTYEFSYVSFAMATPNQEPQWQGLYYPLAYQVWLSIMGLVFLVPLTYIAVKYFIVIKNHFLINLFPIFTALLYSDHCTLWMIFYFIIFF